MPANPLQLTDDQLSAVIAATGPLQPEARAAFLEALARELRKEPVVGDGSLHRAIRELQKRFRDAPLDHTGGGRGVGKYA